MLKSGDPDMSVQKFKKTNRHLWRSLPADTIPKKRSPRHRGDVISVSKLSMEDPSSSVADLDAWIEKLYSCKSLTEQEVKSLCEKVSSRTQRIHTIIIY